MTHPKKMKGLKVTKHIRARSPLRISLSGGGTDIEDSTDDDIFGAVLTTVFKF